MKKLLLVSLCILFFSIQIFAQDRTIKGTVTAKDDGGPIPGASVRVVGSNTGTQTSADGKYSITVPSGKTLLEFSFIGYATTVKEVTGSTLNIALELSNKELGEVVVTALGIRREKKALGYAIQDVKGSDLVAAGETDALKGLSGKVAGVQITSSTGTPGAAVYIQIRGQNSLTQNNQPLFIVDGIPIDNSFNQTALGGGSQATQTNRGVDINPDDVESMSVLKGPAAAALYGIRAANGAIVITTKKGKAGATQVDVNSSVSFNSVNKLPGLQNQWIKGLGNVLGAKSAYTSTNRYSWGPKADTLFWTGVPNEYDVHGNIVGKSNPAAKIPFTPYDNLHSFFKTGASYDNSFAISGGTDIANYRTSITNSYQNSIIPTEYYQRTTISFAGQLQMSKKLKAATNISYTGSDGSQPQTGSNVSGIMLGLTRTPISFDNSNGTTDPTDPKAYILANGSPRSYRTAIYDNPYWTINQNPFTTNVARINGSFQLDYNIGSGFSALYRIGTDSYQDNRQQYYELQSGASPGGLIIEDRYTYRSLNSDLILSYSKKLSDSFQFDAKIGNNFYGNKNDELSVTGSGLVAAGFQNIANASTVNSFGGAVVNRSYSFYYDLNLSYKSILYLETTGRNDHVSTLPAANNSFFYPSASMSFVFSELGDLKGSNVLSFGKIRANITQVGNIPGPYQTRSGYVSSSYADGFTTGIVYPISGLSSFSPSTNLGNPLLKPEISTAYEIGTQLQFFRNRLGIDATVYYDKSTNDIVTAAISGSTGYQTLTENSGSIRNEGLEIQLTGAPVKTRDFNWNTFVNFSLNRGKVLALAPGVNALFLGGFGNGEAAIENVPGAAPSIIYANGYTRDANNNIVIDDANNKGYPLSNTAVQKVIGDPNPKFLMGWGNTFSYKKLSLYGLIDWKFKGDVWDGTRGSLAAIGRSDLTNNRNTSTVFPGTLGHISSAGNLVHYAADGVTELPGAGATNGKSVLLDQAWYQGDGGGFGNLDEQFIEDGSYIKLRELTLTYDLKDLLFGKSSSFVKGVTLGAFVRNVIIWTPYKGVDPETNLQGAATSGGIDYFNNPGVKTIGLNVKVKF